MDVRWERDVGRARYFGRIHGTEMTWMLEAAVAGPNPSSGIGRRCGEP